MSWDLIIQHMPPGVQAVDDLPEDYEPEPLGRREDLMCLIHRAAPDVDFSDSGQGILDRGDYCIEIDMGEDELCDSIMLYVRGNGNPIPTITRLVEELGLPAIDCQASALYNPKVALQTFQYWQQCRNQLTRPAKRWWEFWK